MLPDHASKGYHCVSDTAEHAVNFYGFTVTTAAAVTALVGPSPKGPEGYTGDETGVAALTTLPPGYYPIRGSSITLGSGEAILWLE